MAGSATTLASPVSRNSRFQANPATRDSSAARLVVLTLSLAFFALFLALPLVAVFYEALRKGWSVYIAALVEPDAVAAMKLTLTAAAISVPLNLVFGIAAAWCIAKFEFRGKSGMPGMCPRTQNSSWARSLYPTVMARSVSSKQTAVSCSIS